MALSGSLVLCKFISSAKGLLSDLGDSDLTSVHSLQDIPGGLIIIENKGLFFYHEEVDGLPPPGEGVRASTSLVGEGSLTITS